MTSSAISGSTQVRPATKRSRQLSSRLRLIGAGVAAIVFTIVAIGWAVNAYGATLSQFQIIVESNAAKINASEAALANIAGVDTSAADFVATASDNPKHWASLDAIHTNYEAFRTEMFLVRSNLTTDAETAAFKNAEYFAFDQFWTHIGNMLTAQTNGDKTTALAQYIIADNYLQNQIARYLLELERLNFNSMVATKDAASGQIAGLTFTLAVIVFILAIGITAISFWLRGKLRRYLTPGIDIAMVVAWLVAVLMVRDLALMPGNLDLMVNQSYLSVTASARTLANASLASSSESAAVIDPTNAAYWNANFDTNRILVEKRICGAENCTKAPFISGNGTLIASVVDQAARLDASTIGNVRPLVASVDFAGESQALEAARGAWNDYMTINQNVRTLLQTNKIDAATDLSTGEGAGQSDEAFKRFTKAIDTVRSINLQVFDDTWHSVQNTLRNNQFIFAILGYLLVIATISIGVYHRFREL